MWLRVQHCLLLFLITAFLPKKENIEKGIQLAFNTKHICNLNLKVPITKGVDEQNLFLFQVPIEILQYPKEYMEMKGQVIIIVHEALIKYITPNRNY